MKNAPKHRTHTFGIITAAIILLTFCEISTKHLTLSLLGAHQFLIILLFSFMFIFINVEKLKLHRGNEIKNYSFFLLFLISISLSLINTEEILISAERLFVMITTTILTLAIAHSSSKPQEFFQGFSVGVITITSISILYSIITAFSDFNFIDQETYGVATTSILGIDLKQNIAYRAYAFDGTTYYIQRYGGIFPNPNGLGLMSAISFSLAYNFVTRRKLKILAQIVCLIGLAISLSRMGIVLFFASLIYYHARSAAIRLPLCALMIIGLVIFLSATIISPELAEYFGEPIIPLINQEFLQLGERTQLMTMAWQGFRENWLLGVGYGVGAEYLFQNNADTQAIHSVFLNAMLETGIIGSTALVIIWLLPVFATKVGKKQKDGPQYQRHIIASILFGLFFAQAFDLSVMRFHYIHIIFFFLIGAWFTLGRDLKDTDSNDVQCTRTQQTLSKRMESS